MDHQKLESGIMHKNNALTIYNLYQVVRRPIIAFEAERKVDLHSVLKYELMPVPVGYCSRLQR